MKLFTKAALVLATSTAFAVSAQAANFGALSTGNAYVGVKAGQFLFDSSYENLDDLTAFGAYAGYNFDQNFGVEAEFLGTKKNNFRDIIEYHAQSAGLYGTYRYNFETVPVYAKAKLGLSTAKVKAESITPNLIFDESSSETGVAGGLGLGYKPTQNIGVELAYDRVAGDLNLVTLGAHFAF